jgi:very-short-patch-repair endonuclease
MAASNAVRTITCQGCGVTVTGRFRPPQHYCSLECYRRSSRPQRKTGADVVCTLCGVTFYLPAIRIAQASHYFCCHKHATDWQGRNKTNHTCEVCGNAFRWSPSREKANNIRYCSQDCRNKDPQQRERLLTLCANQRKQRPNANEVRGYALLDALGVRYEKEAPLAGKFIVDALLLDHPMIVQFDGDYWHGNPAKYPSPDARQTRRATLDSSQDAYLAKCGYRVVRLWESTLKDHPDEATAQVRAALTQP